MLVIEINFSCNIGKYYLVQTINCIFNNIQFIAMVAVSQLSHQKKPWKNFDLKISVRVILDTYL